MYRYTVQICFWKYCKVYLMENRTFLLHLKHLSVGITVKIVTVMCGDEREGGPVGNAGMPVITEMWREDK